MRSGDRAQNAGPRVVVIGGGTGLSTMLRGLKRFSENITAIVSVADDGGGSGMLREELGMLPPGDIRNCIQALANTEPTMEALLGYRFTEGSLKGQSFGNLFLAALNGMSESFDRAVIKMSEVLAITGRVLPVTNENVRLTAEFSDGTILPGQSKITKGKLEDGLHIRRVFLSPEKPETLPACVDAIDEAEMIILGPGSLYTSIIPNLLVKGIPEAIARSDALRVMVLNVMTQNGESEGYKASDHIKALFDHAGGKMCDYCLANSTAVPREMLTRYGRADAEPTEVDEREVNRLGVSVIMAPVASWDSGVVRHDPGRLAEELMCLFREKSPTKVYT